jgi:hypothetical protein
MLRKIRSLTSCAHLRLKKKCDYFLPTDNHLSEVLLVELQCDSASPFRIQVPVNIVQYLSYTQKKQE